MGYRELMEKSDECCRKATEFYKKGDMEMMAFFKNASIGYKEKALKLKVNDGD